MRISDWSSDVCSSDLGRTARLGCLPGAGDALSPGGEEPAPAFASGLFTQEDGGQNMGDSMAGKTALVTAAAQGIGRATALAFAADGAEVLGPDLAIEPQEELAATPGNAVRRLDYLDAPAVNMRAPQ